VIDLLIVLLVPALRFLKEPKKYWYYFWAPLPAYLIDVVIAHTTWALVAGFPKIGEETISDTLERLCNDIANPDFELFVQIALKINRTVGYNHIKAAPLR
jgi:hypothetical protein